MREVGGRKRERAALAQRFEQRDQECTAFARRGRARELIDEHKRQSEFAAQKRAQRDDFGAERREEAVVFGRGPDAEPRDLVDEWQSRGRCRDGDAERDAGNKKT